MQNNGISGLASAYKCLNADKLEKAMVVCGFIIREFPGQPDALNMLGVISLRQCEYMKAKKNISGGFHEIRYEELVQNPEEATRNLLEYVGLPWDPACLSYYETDRRVRTASHDQVRQPLYSSSIGRWKRYEKFFSDFHEGVEKFGGMLE